MATFGVTLQQLLRDTQSSARALAKQLQVDPSLVYRWLRDERVPQLNSEYTDEIVAILRLTRAQQDALQASQVHSLGLPRESRPRRLDAARAVEDLLARGHRSPAMNGHRATSPDTPGGPQGTTHQATVPVPSRHLSASRPASQERASAPATVSTVVRGRDELLRAGFGLLANVPPPPDPANNTILVTALDRAQWGPSDGRAQYDGWTALVRKVCARGWQVRQLWRLDSNMHRAFAAARLVLDLAGSCRYTMLGLPPYDRVLAVHDLLVVPGVAALITFPTVSPDVVDGGIIVRDPDQVQLLQDHFQQLALRAHELLQIHVATDGTAMEGLSVAAEEQFPGRDLIKDGLSLITRPKSWYSTTSRLVQRSRLQGAALEAAIGHRRRRIQAFERHVTHAQYRDICPMDAVLRLVHDGHDMPTSLDDGQPIVPIAQRIAHIEHTIATLRAHERYELALVDMPERKNVPIPSHGFWEIVGDMRVFTHVTVDDGSGDESRAGVMISEGLLVAAFRQYFDELWERISPRNRDKDFVIWWLERQLEQLK